MATESPLTHDGSQMTASEDMSTGLTGANSTGQFLAVLVSGARTVAHDSTGGSVIYGILQNAPKLGQAADVGVLGISKAMAGAAITAGAQLQSNSAGRVITATSTNHRFAIALEAATGAGQIISVLVNGANTTA